MPYPIGARVRSFSSRCFISYSTNDIFEPKTHYGLTNTISSLQCTSNETLLSQCNFSTQALSEPWFIFHCELPRVRCQIIRDSMLWYWHMILKLTFLYYRYPWCTSKFSSNWCDFDYNYFNLVSSSEIRKIWITYLQLYHQLFNTFPLKTWQNC